MAVQPRDPKKAQTEPEKKKTETVLLSAEELRRLSGGAGNPVNIQPKPADIKKV